jgi:glycosyltransferase involved in cell wall biosynthesis
MAHLTDRPEVTLDVVGDGEDRHACEQETAALGVSDRVRFWGRLPRARVEEFYAGADAFVFPSFREPSGNVVIEAMSHGLPLVVADRGGPGHVVSDGCGIRVPVTTPQRYPVDLAAAIRRLATEWGLADRLGSGARRRVADDFLWDRKVDRLDELYADVLDPFRVSAVTAMRRSA